MELWPHDKRTTSYLSTMGIQVRDGEGAYQMLQQRGVLSFNDSYDPKKDEHYIAREKIVGYSFARNLSSLTLLKVGTA